MNNKQGAYHGGLARKLTTVAVLFVKAFWEWRRTQSELRELLDADDRIIRDVGLTHDQAMHLKRRNSFRYTLRMTLRGRALWGLPETGTGGRSSVLHLSPHEKT